MSQAQPLLAIPPQATRQDYSGLDSPIILHSTCPLNFLIQSVPVSFHQTRGKHISKGPGRQRLAQPPPCETFLFTARTAVLTLIFHSVWSQIKLKPENVQIISRGDGRGSTNDPPGFSYLRLPHDILLFVLDLFDRRILPVCRIVRDGLAIRHCLQNRQSHRCL